MAAPRFSQGAVSSFGDYCLLIFRKVCGEGVCIVKYKDVKEHVALWEKSKEEELKVSREVLIAIGNEALAYRRQAATKARAKLIVPKTDK